MCWLLCFIFCVCGEKCRQGGVGERGRGRGGCEWLCVGGLVVCYCFCLVSFGFCVFVLLEKVKLELIGKGFLSLCLCFCVCVVCWDVCLFS